VWRPTAIAAALTLAGLLFVIAPGSIEVIRVQPSSLTTALPSWSRPCVIDTPPPDDSGAVAFCARVHGRVVGLVPRAASGDGARHVLVTGAFHLTVVELGSTMPTPALGSLITAVGPLQRGGFRLRELIALTMGNA
jgi:hypothetical protein